MTQDHGADPGGFGPTPFPSQRPPEQKSLEVSGRTVDEAIERGLRSLRVDRGHIDVEVVDEGSRGVLGIGSREARVRLTLRSGKAEIAGAVARDVLGFMGISAGVTAVDGPESIRVSVEGTNVGPLIGKHGQTLGAVEVLVALLVGRKAGGPVRIELDAEGYRERREVSLQDLARRTAERVARQGREIALTPMGPRDRRIIHVTLQDHPRVSTVSRGEHDMRRVVVMPKSGQASREGQGDEDQPPGPEGQARGPSVGSEGQSGVPSQGEIKRVDRGVGSGRSSRYSRRRPGEGRSGRRPARQGSGGAFGGRTEVPGQRPAKGSRPEGLPVEEELEAEIEAYLARTRGEKKVDQSDQEPPQEPSREGE